MSFAFTLLHAEDVLLALQMPGEVLPLTPEFEDITFSLQCSMSPHNPRLPDNLLSIPMINKKTHWHCPFLFGFWTLCAPREISFSSAASLLSLVWGEGQLWHCIPVCAHYQQRKEISYMSYSCRNVGGSPFQLQNFSLLTIITIYVFSRRHILPRWSSWVFVKKMHFPLSSGKLLAFRWVATSLKSLPLPSLRASQVT